ncbi:hypothetical protein ACFFNY_05615 [Paenibacillus hodogayensis]|uniref:Glycosyltransferase RgtA/B/C/D-like domain-containing protein n=1 Tax=Paenibacillus hodogayensis TaxID=279208 RepID=A0ABV5VS09_9BACL
MKLFRFIGLTLVFICFVSSYYYFLSLRVPMNSDGANSVLQAKDMLEGNIFLREWYLSTGAYISTDLLIYSLMIPIVGFSTNVIYVSSALLYGLLVVISVWISAKSGEKFSYRGAIVTFSILAVPNLFLSNMVFSGPMHISSLVYCLIGLFVWEHAHNIYIKYGSLFFSTTIVLISDPFAIWFFVLPFSLACLYRIFRDRHEIYSLLTVIMSYVLSKIVLIVIDLSIPSVGTIRFLEIEELKKNLGLALKGILELYGANFTGKPMSVSTLIIIIHLFTFILICWVCYRAVRAINMKVSTFELFLILAVCLNVIEYVGSNMPIDLATTRYIIPGFVFFSIYLGKYALNRLEDKKITAVLFILLAFYFVTTLQKVEYKKPVAFHAEVTEFLRGKGLKYGYGSYWNSSIITLESDEEVRVRPIVNEKDITPYPWLSKSSWYNDKANFVVFDSSNWGNINQDVLIRKFGEPENIYQIKDFTILTWNKDISYILTK